MGQSKKTLIALAAVVAVAVVVLLIAGVGGASAEEVRFQNASDPGPKPFTPPTDVPKAPSRSSSSGASSSSSSSSSGSSSTDTPGSTGSSTAESTASSGKSTVCDREKLAAELTADPAKLSPWADAVGIDADPPSVAAYIRKLRPVTLTRDTQVTDRFYDDGSAQPYQAILPKGTAALVDEEGKPIVRCRSGSPLAEPVELEKQTKCLNCPANYQPSPSGSNSGRLGPLPCEGKCYRPVIDPPPVEPPTAPVIPPTDPIATTKTELEKCRKDKGGLKGCELEYESARKECAANPLNPLCDSSICFGLVEASSDGCSSYISDADIANFCFSQIKDPTGRAECQNGLAGTQKRCGANPAGPGCMVPPQVKAAGLRRKCTDDGGRPECKTLQVGCAKDPSQDGCQQLQNACAKNPARADCKAASDFKQACAKDPTRPECKDLPKTPAQALKGEAKPDAQQGDQGTGAEGPGQEPGGDQEPGGGQAPGTGGETPQPENPAPPPENPAPKPETPSPPEGR